MSESRVVLSSAEYRVVTDRYSGYEAQYRTSLVAVLADHFKRQYQPDHR